MNVLRTTPRARASLSLAVGIALISPPGSTAQQPPVRGAREEYLRTLQLLGVAAPGSLTALPVRALNGGASLAPGSHPWVEHFDSARGRAPGRPWASIDGIGTRTFLNSSLPVGQNDGAVWQGKGVTTALDAGATAGWRGVTLTVWPTLIYTQNASFELAPVTLPNMPIYAYPWRVIDMPQRFGPDGFWTLDAGQSELSVRGHGARGGVSTANLWWGPGQRSAIVMSNNAAGFPHLFLGTDGPLGIGIGDLEVQWLWGTLDQTEWFDPALADTDRFITGLVAAYSPSFLGGLTLGLTRVFYAWAPDRGVPLSDYFLVLQGVRKDRFRTPQNPGGDDEHDQLLSLFARWVISPAGFEVYAEWARNDHSRDFRDFILQPAHSRGYVLGLQRALELSGNRLLALRAEIIDLEKARHPRATPTYYAHHIVRQGYTNGGQIIGAGIGPGGNSQYLGVDLYAPWGEAGAFVQRDVRDNDAFQVWTVGQPTKYWEHDVSLHFGAHGRTFAGGIEPGLGVVLTRELNRFFAGRDLWNLNLSASARWRPD